MIVIDIESTGLNPYTHGIISIGAVDFCNPENQFYQECRIREDAAIDPQALAISGAIQAEITNMRRMSEQHCVSLLLSWIATCEQPMLAGANPSIDRDFLRVACRRYELSWPLGHRTIDVEALAYARCLQLGHTVVSHDECPGLGLDAVLEFVGLPSRTATHNALHDAQLEAECLSRLVYGRSLFAQFEQYQIPDNII